MMKPTQTIQTFPDRDVLYFDCEATIHAKGNPFSRSNRLMCVGTLFNGDLVYHDIEHSGLPYQRSLEFLSRLFAQAKLIVGFNIKYDLHWIRRYIPAVHFPPVADLQLCEFLLSDQRVPYPSLASTSEHYGLAGKLDTVALEYWDNGVDTSGVPQDVLKEYCLQDVRLLPDIWKYQQERLEKKNQQALFKLQCDDLLVLQEMEFNGMLFNEEAAHAANIQAQTRLDEIHQELKSVVGDTQGLINWNSNHHLSVVLYGGYIEYYGIKEEGMRGRPILKQEFPRLVTPLKGSETTKTSGLSDSDLREINSQRVQEKKRPLQRIYYTNEPVLRSLRPTRKAKDIIKLILEHSELEKLCSTYYTGIPEVIKEHDWEPGILHGRFNQCVAVTGRLSSSQPNLQNFASSIKFLFGTRNGVLLNVDVKALEWVACLYLCQDATGIREILDKIDQHSENVAALGLSNVIEDPKLARLIAKIFLFRLIFGGTAYAFANDPDFTGVSTEVDFWQDIIDKTYRKYKGLKKWHDDLVRKVVQDGKLIMPTTRQYHYVRKNGNWPITTILNYPVQGLGAELVSIIRVSLFKRMKKAGLKSLLICTVHDSILVDAYKEEVPKLIEIMDGVFKDVPKNFEKLFKVEFNLPLRGEISQGTTWGNLEECGYAN